MPSSPTSSEGAAFAKIGEEPGGQDPRRCMPQHGDEHLEFWTAQASPPDCFVYVVRAEDDPPIKVGRATDVRDRIGRLQTGNARRLQLLHVVPGAAELEWQLHHRIRESRLIGEWFGGEEIPAFLGFIQDLAEFFIAGWNETGAIPDFRRFRDGWSLRRPGQGPARVTFTDPDPVWVKRMEERRRIEAEPREFVASEREKAWFAQAHSHPTFTPHR